MPLVAEREEEHRAERRVGTLFSRCANPRCATGWMRLWRSRRVPGFEGRWACSSECMAELVGAAVRREAGNEDAGPAAYTHRVPLGLTLLQQGQITEEQLRRALDGQRRAAASTGAPLRLGEWLVECGVITEDVLARALGAQWGCPVVRLEGPRAATAAAVVPQFLAEALGAAPAGIAQERLVYLVFSNGVDRSLSYAVERMTGLRVTAGVALDSEFGPAQADFLAAVAPRARFLETASPGILVRALTKVIESEKPAEARLVRIHNWYWVRLWGNPPEPGLPAVGEVEDMICTVAPIREGWA